MDRSMSSRSSSPSLEGRSSLSPSHPLSSSSPSPSSSSSPSSPLSEGEEAEEECSTSSFPPSVERVTARVGGGEAEEWTGW